MRNLNSKKYIPMLFALAAIIFFSRPMQVSAEEASVTFGSDSYSKESGEEFPVGVYIRGESKIGTYYAEVEYDTSRMQYLGGGDSEQDGIIILRGTGLGDKVKYMLYFRSLGGGEAGIRIRTASIQMAEADGSADFTVTTLASAPITISGTDETGIAFLDSIATETESEQEEEDSLEENFGINTEIPILAAIDTENGKRYYLVDHARYVPYTVQWKYRSVSGHYQEQPVTFLTNEAGTVQLLYLMDAEQNFYPFAYNREKDLLYPCHETAGNDTSYLYMSPYACNVWPDELTIQAIAEDFVFFAMDTEGNGDFYQFDTDGNLMQWNFEQSDASDSNQGRKLTYILATAGIVLVFTGIIAHGAAKGKQQKRQKYQQYEKLQKRLEEQEGRKVRESELYFEDFDEVESVMLSDTDWLQDMPAKANVEQPVISVQDVTMIFHISTSNASGIKEYLIQWLKHQVKFRELVALDHVSFDVFKGEVVGVIGTNGSGKSTLLRIVSGALNPTSGQVIVDRRKVQLLTLGTGFDMELSARENVYLNGSIIGYSREFLDAHYEEIVEFAGLKDFMEEKVKNFSSGMVSRLGFAIATAGDAAEILILDEVLSVGDEFFRKKSLKRIKEMIHGGSTVLIVSHSMGTILENCTKVVWIEKGQMKMVGDAEMICGEYQKTED